jgi:hypothetical protein
LLEVEVFEGSPYERSFGSYDGRLGVPADNQGSHTKIAREQREYLRIKNQETPSWGE